MNCISAAETGFCTKRCTSDEQTPRPPSPAHHKTFRPLHKYKSFAIPLTLRCRRVWSSNLSTQLRRTQGLNTESLTMPATVADPNRSLDSEHISPATIAHHTVYEKIPNLHQSHMCQWGAQPYLVGPLSRLVGKPPFSPRLPRNILPLKRAANGPNSAISLTQTFDRISLYVYNSLYFGVQKAKNGDRETIVFTATLRVPYTQYLVWIFICICMSLRVFLFAKKMKFLTKGGIHCISQVFLWHFYFMREYSLVELTEHDDSAANIIVHSMYTYMCCCIHSTY